MKAKTQNGDATPGTVNSDPIRLLYTESQAAQLLSISPRSLQKLRKARQVKFVKIGDSGIRYSPRALQEWVDQSLTTDHEERTETAAE